MKRHLVTVAFLMAALFCYAVGSNFGVIAFVAAGLVLEVVFWSRLIHRRRR
jgi:hypothetical protein